MTYRLKYNKYLYWHLLEKDMKSTDNKASI